MSSRAAHHVKNAPSSNLVFAYLIVGLLAFLFLGGWSFISYSEWGGFYANTRFLAWVHVAVLLWLNMVIFGVLFQFVPVVLNVRLGSEKLAWWQMGFYLPGAIGMAACFWFDRLDWPLHSFASVLWVGFFLFVWNLLITYRNVKAWTLTAKFIFAAVLYLLATILLGLFLSIHLAYPMIEMSHLTLLKLHANGGLAGWFLMLVIGVSLKLLPMFLLAHGYATKPGEVAFYLMNAGLLGWIAAVAMELPVFWQQLGVLALGGGIVCYLIQAALIFQKRNRVRSDPFRRQAVRRIDFPLRFAAAALAFLGAVAIFAGVMVFFEVLIADDWRNRLVIVYGAAIFLGFLSLLTQALLYKIIPFLVWLRKFGDGVGRVKTPRIDDLVPRHSAVWQLFFYCGATAVILVALAADHRQLAGVGTLMLFVSTCWLTGNLISVWKRAVPLGRIVSAPSCEERASVKDRP